MSDFSAAWLDLREPHDHAARSRQLEERLLDWDKAHECRIVADLGAGTGSNRRALSAVLPAGQSWYLIENDPVLIGAGRARLDADARATVRYVEANLAQELETAVPADVDLLTCSALLDLASLEWLQRLADLARSRNAALLAVLTHDGQIRWWPGDPFDVRIATLFERHQRTDKGFGPARGGDAANLLADMLAGDGTVIRDTSPWQLDTDDRRMQRALLEGYAAAAREIEPHEAEEIDGWNLQRLKMIEAGRSKLRVGHIDLLFLPR